MSAPLHLTIDQALYFRAIRGFLAGPGAPGDAAEAALHVARAMVGVQSQQLGPSSHGVNLRASERPTAAALKAALFDRTSPSVVRTWAQRETIHLLDPADWPTVVAARAQWASGGRRGLQPPEVDVAMAQRVVEAAGRPVTRSDLGAHISADYHAAVRPQIEKNAKYLFKATPTADQLDAETRRFTAGRLLWTLANQGVLCAADKAGKEQAYAARAAWFPQLAWSAPPADDANRALIRRYLAVAAPATAQDIGHFFGARMADVKRWLAGMQDELVAVVCGTKKGLLARAEDAEALSLQPGASDAAWPLRLLPMWDGMMMTHADKTWTLPDTAEHKLVWRRAAVVAPVVLARGRIVATWSHKAKTSAVDVAVTPLSAWSTDYLGAVQREADALAAHLELAGARVSVVTG